jgi:hypothetical protein
MLAQNADLRSHMLVLHENLVERIATIGEGLPRARRGPRKKR